MGMVGTLSHRALLVLKDDPDALLSAAEVAERAGCSATRADLVRWERALLMLVDNDLAFPQNVPRGPRRYRLRAVVVVRDGPG